MGPGGVLTGAADSPGRTTGQIGIRRATTWEPSVAMLAKAHERVSSCTEVGTISEVQVESDSEEIDDGHRPHETF